MSLNLNIKNAPQHILPFHDIKSAFFQFEPGLGITSKQLTSLAEKMPNSEQYELITIEGEHVTAMGIIDMNWFDTMFDYDPVKIKRFVQKVINGVYEKTEDDIYYLKGDQVYVACPDTY